MVEQAPGVSVSIAAESIYADSLATITLSSSSPFVAAISGIMISVHKGIASSSPGTFSSADTDGRCFVEVVVSQAFREREVSSSYENTLTNAYGMRFYPFVSSVLVTNITIHDQHVDIVLLDLPDRYRVLWKMADVIGDDFSKAFIKHAYGPERSTYIFKWEDEGARPKSVSTHVATRFGGKAFLRMVNFPFMYWLLSLFIIAIASTSDKAGILLAAVGATWIFMLRQWNLSESPQEDTLLTHAYFAHGLFVIVWAAAWHQYSYLALLTTPVIALFVYLVHFSTQCFRNHGALPKIIAEYWLRKILHK